MGCGKSWSKREFCSKTILPQGTRKVSSKQPNPMPVPSRERTNPELAERKKPQNQTRINEIQTTKIKEKINRNKAGSMKR